MCSMHHRDYHQKGHDTFEKLYHLDLAKLAAEFASKTPDEKLREALAEKKIGLMI